MVFVVETITIAILYHSAIAEEKLRLQETVTSQARLIEAVARFDKIYSSDYPHGARQATITQIQDAHPQYRGFGETGEFTLSTRENNQIVFLLNHRHHDLNNPHSVPWDSELAEPMRLALSGKHGIIIGLDYRGEKVLAAYEPLADLDLGIVAKIDLSEVRAPFVKASFISGLLAIMVIGFGVVFFFKITNPLLQGLHDKVVGLKEAEKRLREVFIFMKGGGGVYKPVDDGDDFIIVDYCRPDLKDLKTTNENLTGKKILDVFPASREYGLFDVLQRVWKTGMPEHHPVTIYDGERIVGWRENYVYKLSSGEIVALYEDVTEKKQMEILLRESEILFRSIFETSPDPINLNNLEDGKFMFVNDKFLELTGFSMQEIIGRTALEINLWNDPRRRVQFFAQIENMSQVSDFEAEFRRKDGTILTSLSSAQSLIYQNKPHVLVVSRDITELKKTQQALQDANTELEQRYEISSERLKASEIKYSSLVEALLTGVYMCIETKIVFVNKQFAEMFGYTKDELRGMEMNDLIHPEDNEDAKSIFSISSSGETVDHEYEVRGVRKNGESIYLSGKNTAIEFQGQQAILGNIANISKRKKAEKELQKSEEGLRALSAQLLSAEERERKRIASDIHDSIGQALSAIKFSVESSLLSIRNQSLPSAQKSLEKIIPLTQQSIDEVRRIIMDLRPSTLDDLGLVATISWFCRDFESIFMDISVEKEIHVQEDDISVPLKTVIYRIMQEALNNAAKYSRTNSILLKLARTEEYLELLIEDKGVGFELDGAVEGKGGRKGLGLSSMKERASLSGGTFTILTALGIGTRIQVLWTLTGGDGSGEM